MLAQAALTPAYVVTQIFNGLVNGGFYALLALGLSIIFGMLRIVNFAHGAMYMLGAFVAYYGAPVRRICRFFAALIVAPLVVGRVRPSGGGAAPAPPLRSRPALQSAVHVRASC